MANEFLLVTQFFSVVVMLALAGWLLGLNARSAVNRSFAAFLLLKSLQVLFPLFERIADDPRMSDLWGVMAEYMYLAIPFSLAYFGIVYLRPRGDLWLRLGCIGGAGIVLALYASNHCLDICQASDGLEQLGPLSLFSHGAPLVAGAVGLAIAAAIRFGSFRPQANVSALVAAAFILTAVFNGVLAWTVLVKFGWGAQLGQYVVNGWQWVGAVMFGIAIIPGLVGSRILHSQYARRGDSRNQGTVFLVALSFSVLSALFVGGTAGTSFSDGWALFVTGLWLLLPLAFIAYALLRHRLLGIDHRVKVVVRSSTVAAFFGGAFFVGAELLEDLIQLPGVVLGLAAAGAIALALRPIQSLANRLADKAFPNIRPVLELTAKEREDLYREQAVLVWADGVVGTKEQALLDRLRHRLNLSAKTAANIERSVEASVLRRA